MKTGNGRPYTRVAVLVPVAVASIFKIVRQCEMSSAAIGVRLNPTRSQGNASPSTFASMSVPSQSLLSAEEGGLENAGRSVDQHMKEDHSFRELSGQLLIPSHSKKNTDKFVQMICDLSEVEGRDAACYCCSWWALFRKKNMIPLPVRSFRASRTIVLHVEYRPLLL